MKSYLFLVCTVFPYPASKFIIEYVMAAALSIALAPTEAEPIEESQLTGTSTLEWS